jgi:predicted regulator of Ras-like GTPase activity (Roadblock/LC7/MglB family)
MTALGAATYGHGQAPADIAGLVDQFAGTVPGVTHVLLLSGDGLRLAVSRAVDRDLADQLAAVGSGLLSMADQSGRLLGMGLSDYLTLRFSHGHLVLMRVAESAGLVVAAAPGCDLRIVAHQMRQLVESVGHALTPQARGQLHASAEATTAR